MLQWQSTWPAAAKPETFPVWSFTEEIYPILLIITHAFCTRKYTDHALAYVFVSCIVSNKPDKKYIEPEKMIGQECAPLPCTIKGLPHPEADCSLHLLSIFFLESGRNLQANRPHVPPRSVAGLFSKQGGLLHLSTRGWPNTAYERLRTDIPLFNGERSEFTICLDEFLHLKHISQRWHDVEE